MKASKLEKEDNKAKPQDASTSMLTDKERKQRQLNRERQRRYRQRALKDWDGLLLIRLQVMISIHADGCLTRICEKTGMTKREAVEKALIELERRVTE